MWQPILAVGVGAALGALLRWQISIIMNPLTTFMPLGTLMVNGGGGYLVGVALAWISHHPDINPLWRLWWITGFCGGLTTFSSYSAEVVQSLQEGRIISAFAITFLHLIISFSATALGLWSVAFYLKPS